jgi:hypothetical protein
MGSVAEPRYCAKDEQCEWYDPASGKAQKLGALHTDNVCRRCREAEGAAEDEPAHVPPEHKELVRAAQVLLEHGIEEEYRIIPTLVFAAFVEETSGLAGEPSGWAKVRRKFVEAGNDPKAWQELRSFWDTAESTVREELERERHQRLDDVQRERAERLEAQERAKQLEQERSQLEAEHRRAQEERDRLQEELEAERGKGFWRKLFVG